MAGYIGGIGQVSFCYQRLKLNEPITVKLQVQHVSATDANDVTVAP